MAEVIGVQEEGEDGTISSLFETRLFPLEFRLEFLQWSLI